ncbi:MAG: glycosyltransferase [Alphaproteobacteria bacterium]|nr:MAG: glycosyltransferase [Alphaproteobacteria bacterium]
MQNRQKRHFFHVLPTFAPGGVQIRVAYLLNHLRLPARHTIVALDGDTSASSRLSSDIDVAFATPPLGGGLAGRIRACRRVLATHKPDLLLTYQWGAIEWALANRWAPICPHIHLESGFGAEEAERQLARRVWTRRIALGRVDKLIVPSQTLVRIATREWRIPSAKVCYIPNGVDCEKYGQPPRPGAIPGFAKREGETVVGTLTPLRPEKNLTRLIRAFATVLPTNPECRLIIMGEGGEREKLEALVQALGLHDRVVLPGHIDHPEAALGWLDLYAISSDTEQMPNAVNQAMAAGLAVVGLDVGDVRHIVSDANKPFIAKRGDESEFARHMARLVSDIRLRRDVGRANQEHVRRAYTLDGMLRAYECAWGEVS